MKKIYIQPEMLHFVLNGELMLGGSITRNSTGTTETAAVTPTDDEYNETFCSRRPSIWDDEEDEDI